ncbi:golvesin C-terminal-like domain-containing protein [Streptomyces sennicomposti]|uniref:golvesin C-terminal-like domain-containing protein n=1 Tax=Streptomyces sennicomposti TaxID=2873384 RepID=UPI001CA7592C|nr:hypothetical protein [Streptomyces sennicomposti]MBY8870162.1 hypothetical protein [Streptomyces sennicomposti]
MKTRRRKQAWLVAVSVCAALTCGLVQTPAALAASPVADGSLPSGQVTDPDKEPAKNAQEGIPPQQRQNLLGKDYKKSNDLAWTTTGDARGFHVLTATASSGYTWKTLASLAEPGFDADQWVGNACVTGSGKQAVVVYAPRAFTNDPKLMARGGFTAIVDLVTGRTRKLKLNASLSYYNPGCGAGDDAVFTQSPGQDQTKTRLFHLNSATGKLSAPIATSGQVTSATPGQHGAIAAAFGRHLVEVDDKGGKKTLATLATTPYRIASDQTGGYTFVQRSRVASVKSAEVATIKHWRRGNLQDLASGELDEIALTRQGPDVLLTGKLKKTAKHLPRGITTAPDTSKDATASTEGRLIVQRTVWADGKASPKYLNRQKATEARPVTITTSIRATKKTATFRTEPMQDKARDWDTSRVPSPLLPGKPKTGGKAGSAHGVSTQTMGTGGISGTTASTTGSRTEVVESERTCSVPRNDVRNQAMQPKPRQVEWAVDKAITGKLNIGASRPANWKNLGMPAYQPQTLFPKPELAGGGERVPAQVFLGVTAQESNMWQAGKEAVPGVTGNPLIGNYYGVDYYDGIPSNDWDVNWGAADCGYGVTQVTDHMRLAGREHGKGGAASPYETQRAIALDYAANVAAGLQILVDKWNQTRNAGMIINNGDPAKLENWFFALWAYNAGFYTNDGTNLWGVGWTNNPANPEWDESRTPFMETSTGTEDASDAAHPQNWPYPEKVLGFAAHPPAYLESPGTMVPAFRAAWWNGAAGDATVKGSAMYNRAHAKPPIDLFCTSDNTCNASAISTSATNQSPSSGPCGRGDLKCWWHKSVTWKSDCSFSCGNEFFRFTSPDYDAEQADGTAYPPTCFRNGLPSGAKVIDDAPTGSPVVRPSCYNGDWLNEGTFGMDFGAGELGLAHDATPATVWPSKIDLHQLGAGFNGHFYFGHTRAADDKGNRLKITGTWALNSPINGPAKIWVHLPDHGAQTTDAEYNVYTAKGVKTRVVNQRGSSNRWVSIGAFLFNAAPKVTLSTITRDGTGDEDIAWDAIAVQPINGKYVERSLTAASVFDPAQNIDSNMPADMYTPLRTRQTLYDWARGHAYQGPRWDNRQVGVNGVTWFPRCSTATPNEECSGQKTWDAANQWWQQIKEGGLDGNSTGGSAPSMSIPMWMAMANPRPNPNLPATQAYQDPNTYKIKSEVEVSYIIDNTTGKIIEGSESSGYDVRVGNAHLPFFVTNFMKAVEADYGITKPYIDYLTKDALSYGRDQIAHPYDDGDTPGQAYFPHLRTARVTPDDTCVDVRAVGGGVHGYRPMVAHKYINDNVKEWVDEINASPDTNYAVRSLAGDIYSLFFKNDGNNNAFGSMIGNAPPIWQDIAVQFCADGSVKPFHAASDSDMDPDYSIVYQSYMPDLYVYVDGSMTDNAGHPSNSPVHSGDWRDFSNLPVGFGHAYGVCDSNARGSGGNPWGIAPPIPYVGDGPGERPTEVRHCDLPLTTFNTSVTP